MFNTSTFQLLVAVAIMLFNWFARAEVLQMLSMQRQTTLWVLVAMQRTCSLTTITFAGVAFAAFTGISGLLLMQCGTHSSPQSQLLLPQ